MRGRLEPFRVRPFGRLLGSYTVNELGDSVGIVALAVLVYDGTESVSATAALFIAAKFLPALIAPAVTARVDQLALRRTLPAIYAVEAGVFVALAALAEVELFLAAIFALALVDGTLAVAARGLTRSAVASVLQPSGLLRAGNALMNVGFAVASVGGAALAGLLISEAGVSTALIIDAASFMTIGVVLRMTRDLPDAHVERQSFRERFRDGLRFARDQRVVRLLLGGQALALVLFTLIIPIEIVYAKESLGTNSAGYGVLLASWGAGIVVGSVVYIGIRERSPLLLILASTAAIGLAYLGMAAAETLLAACLLSVLGGAGNGIQWIAVMTALQEATPLDLQARVAGLMESLGAAMPGLGYVIGAAITALSSPRTAYAVAGTGVMVLVGLACILRPRARAAGRAAGPAAAYQDAARPRAIRETHR